MFFYSYPFDCLHPVIAKIHVIFFLQSFNIILLKIDLFLSFLKSILNLLSTNNHRGNQIFFNKSYIFTSEDKTGDICIGELVSPWNDMSFTHKRATRGHIVDPCGTPQVSFPGSECSLSTLTVNIIFCRYDLYQEKKTLNNLINLKIFHGQ